MAKYVLPVILVLALGLVQCIAADEYQSGGGKRFPPYYRRTPPPAPRCGYGSVCKDPVMKTQNGQEFYFHGIKNADFCLVSDSDLHINAHFIGLTGSTVKHDFTWVQSLGVLFGSNQLYVGAHRVAQWDQEQDQLVLVLNSVPMELPVGAGAAWEDAAYGVKVVRTEPANAVTVEIAGYVKLTVYATPVSEADNAKHGYGVAFDTDVMAHLDVSFEFARLSGQVNGVLGQTYAPHFEMPQQQRNAGIPSMGGMEKYITTGIMAPDCAVSRFNVANAAAEASGLLEDVKPVTCGSGGATGLGMVCRR